MKVQSNQVLIKSFDARGRGALSAAVRAAVEAFIGDSTPRASDQFWHSLGLYYELDIQNAGTLVTLEVQRTAGNSDCGDQVDRESGETMIYIGSDAWYPEADDAHPIDLAGLAEAAGIAEPALPERGEDEEALDFEGRVEPIVDAWLAQPAVKPAVVQSIVNCAERIALDELFERVQDAKEAE